MNQEVYRVVIGFRGTRAKDTMSKASNRNKHGHWRSSSESCHCAATHAPCWVCTASAECMQCGSFELVDEMFRLDMNSDDHVCDLCHERTSYVQR